MVGSLTTSYVRARAEGVGETCFVGFLQRTERVILLTVGLLLGRWALVPVLGFLAVATLATTVQRIVHVAAKLPGAGPPASRDRLPTEPERSRAGEPRTRSRTTRTSRHRGLLITFEGPEGSGKTTLINAMAARLAAQGEEPLVLREPGGTAIGERIRNILLDPASEGMCAETELLLMVASRAQLVREKIEPALEAGMIILCDRFADASVAYQGFGRGLGEKQVQATQRGGPGRPGARSDLSVPAASGRGPGAAGSRGHRPAGPGDRGIPPAGLRGLPGDGGSGDLRFKVIDATAISGRRCWPRPSAI